MLLIWPLEYFFSNFLFSTPITTFRSLSLFSGLFNGPLINSLPLSLTQVPLYYWKHEHDLLTTLSKAHEHLPDCWKYPRLLTTLPCNQPRSYQLHLTLPASLTPMTPNAGCFSHKPAVLVSFCSFMFFHLPQTHVSPVLLVNSYSSFRLSSGEPFSRKPSPDSDPWTMSHISKMDFQTFSTSMPSITAWTILYRYDHSPSGWVSRNA